MPPVTAPLERALLAMFATHVDRAIPLDDLVIGLWGEDDQPDAAEKTVQVLVSRLRRAFRSESSGETIQTVPGGYRLTATTVEIDAVEFESATSRARAAAADGRWQDIASELQVALDLWRGPALMDVRTRPFATHEADRLDELRVAARGDLAEAQLVVGRIDDAVAALGELTRDRRWTNMQVPCICGAVRRRSAADDSRPTLGHVALDGAPHRTVPELDEVQRLVLKPGPVAPGRPPGPDRKHFPDGRAARPRLGDHRPRAGARGLSGLLEQERLSPSRPGRSR